MNNTQYYKENNELFKTFMDGMILDAFKDELHPSYNKTNLEILIPEYNNECMRYVSNNVIARSLENEELDIQTYSDNIKSIFSYIQQNLFKLHSLTINGMNVFSSRYGNIFFNLFKKSPLCNGNIIRNLVIKTNIDDFDERKDSILDLIQSLKLKGIEVLLKFYIYDDPLYCLKNTDFLTEKGLNYKFNIAITPENINNFYEVYMYYKIRFLSHKYNDLVNHVNFFEKISTKWNKSKIGKYINFLEMLWQDKFSEEEPISIIDGLYLFNRCDLLKLSPHLDKFSCGFQDTLYIRSTDLAIIGCPHLKDNHQIYGYIDGKDIRAYNTEFCIAMYSANPASVNMDCGFCKYNKICPKQCPAAQYEWSQEPFLTIPETCDLFKTKIQFLMDKYKETGVLGVLEGGCIEECFQVKAIINEIYNWIE